ncbi:MAG: DUF2793 domain-containing protein [Pseudomonadota bacterium]
MSETTGNLHLPYIASAQAQKHVTHNEALRALDVIVQLSVRSATLNTPPTAPENDTRYIVAQAPSGDWADHAGDVAAWQDGAWSFHAPRDGWIVWDENTGSPLVRHEGAWQALADGATQSIFDKIGINATADPINKLSLKADAALFSHDDITPGTGDVRHVLNKVAAGATVSQVYQSGFVGHAEVGLTGDNDFHFKVSSDGSSFLEGIILDHTTGSAVFPHTVQTARENLLINGAGTLNQRQFAGGTLSSGAYGVDRWKAHAGAADVSVMDGQWTLTSGAIAQIVEPFLFGFSSLGSTVLTLSVEDLAGGDLAVNVGSASGTITAGPGRRAVTLTTAAGDIDNLTVTLAPASAGPITFARIKLEHGAPATPWRDRGYNAEKNLCQRYFQKSYDDADALGSATSRGAVSFYPGRGTSSGMRVFVPLTPSMRTQPTVTTYNPNTGTPNTVNRGGSEVASSVVNRGERGITAGAGAGANASYCTYHFAADAEL